MKSAPSNGSDVNRSAFQLLRRGEPAQSAAKNDDPVFFPHSFSPVHNPVQPCIISSIVNYPALIRGACSTTQSFPFSPKSRHETGPGNAQRRTFECIEKKRTADFNWSETPCAFSARF